MNEKTKYSKKILKVLKETFLEMLRVTPTIIIMWLRAIFIYTPLVSFWFIAYEGNFNTLSMVEIFLSIGTFEFSGAFALVANLIFFLNFTGWLLKRKSQHPRNIFIHKENLHKYNTKNALSQ